MKRTELQLADIQHRDPRLSSPCCDKQLIVEMINNITQHWCIAELPQNRLFIKHPLRFYERNKENNDIQPAGSCINKKAYKGVFSLHNF